MVTPTAATPKPADRPRLSLRYDLRAPDFGAKPGDLYAAALEQAEWAEAHAFDSIWLSEHHCSDDGYCPSPVVMAAAIAGRTERINILLMALVLPLYEPLRLAEDLAVLDLVSGGRVDLVVGAGYRAVELEMFGHTMDERVRLVEEGVEVLRSAWTGEPFEYQSRTVRVRPRPLRPGGPLLKLAGATRGAARRAARIADGFHPLDRGLWQLYADECERLGRVPGPAPVGGGPLFIYVADDPESVWPRIAPHALHETNSYGEWLANADGARPFVPMTDAEQLRESGIYAILTPDECIALAQSTGALTLHPLMGGLPIDLSWESLTLFADKVLPALSVD